MGITQIFHKLDWRLKHTYNLGMTLLSKLYKSLSYLLYTILGGIFSCIAFITINIPLECCIQKEKKNKNEFSWATTANV